MSLYGQTALKEDFEGLDMDEIVESFLYDDLSRMDESQLHEFLESEQCKALVERAVLKKPTLIRLSKEGDAIRRTRLISYQLAKAAKDPGWDQLIKYRAKFKAVRAKIFKKYGAKAQRLAKISQKEYIKRVSREKATAEQNKAQNATS